MWDIAEHDRLAWLRMSAMAPAASERTIEELLDAIEAAAARWLP